MATPVSTGDFVSISRLVHRYSDAVVHRDAERWASCWATDATWDLGQGRLVEGRDAIVALWTSAMSGMVAVVQMSHNGDVEPGVDADHATGRWYIDERFRREGGTNEILLAHYDDGYVRTADGWQFSKRFLQPHYLGPPDLTADFSNTADGLAAREG